MNIPAARAQIEKALPECCAEILDWRKTGMLSGPNLRGIADQHMDGDLQLTEDQVVQCSLRFAIAHNRSE